MQKFYWPSRGHREYQEEIEAVPENIHSLDNSDYFRKNDPQGSDRSRNQYLPLSLAVNTTQGGEQARRRKSSTPAPQPSTCRHTVVRQSDKTCVSVTHDMAAREESERNEVTGRRWNQRNKTWNQNTLRDAEQEFGMMQERGIGKRQSIQNYVFFNNNSETVCNDSENISKAAQGLEKLNLAPGLNADNSCIKPLAIKRQTPRSVKKSRAPVPVHRSKSCDRGGVGAALLDNFSCISRSGRTSPVDSEDQGSVQDESSPAQSLAHRLRGRLKYVNQKMKMIRSRSAERLRGVYTSGVRSEVIAVDHRGLSRQVQTDTVQVYNGPVIGQARAVVDCVPSPYDKDALTFARDDLIDIFDMNTSGLWRGRCGSRIGHFKFVNVEILPPRRRRRSRSRSRSLRRINRKPRNVAEVMKVLKMEEYLPVFVLNGYEDLTLFKDLDNEELDYLGIKDEDQREKLIAMAELLFPESVAKDDSDDISSESGVTDVHSDTSMNSEHSFYTK